MEVIDLFIIHIHLDSTAKNSMVNLLRFQSVPESTNLPPPHIHYISAPHPIQPIYMW